MEPRQSSRCCQGQQCSQKAGRPASNVQRPCQQEHPVCLCRYAGRVSLHGLSARAWMRFRHIAVPCCSCCRRLGPIHLPLSLVKPRHRLHRQQRQAPQPGRRVYPGLLLHWSRVRQQQPGCRHGHPHHDRLRRNADGRRHRHNSQLSNTHPTPQCAQIVCPDSMISFPLFPRNPAPVAQLALCCGGGQMVTHEQQQLQPLATGHTTHSNYCVRSVHGVTALHRSSSHPTRAGADPRGRISNEDKEHGGPAGRPGIASR